MLFLYQDIAHVTDAGDSSWYPREKVNFAHRKLHGDNPAHIMRYFLSTHSCRVLSYVHMYAVIRMYFSTGNIFQ